MKKFLLLVILIMISYGQSIFSIDNNSNFGVGYNIVADERHTFYSNNINLSIKGKVDFSIGIPHNQNNQNVSFAFGYYPDSKHTSLQFAIAKDIKIIGAQLYGESIIGNNTLLKPILSFSVSFISNKNERPFTLSFSPAFQMVSSKTFSYFITPTYGVNLVNSEANTFYGASIGIVLTI